MENIPQAASFDEAVKRLAAKSPVRSTLSSADWAAVPLALRERAQFSARIDNLQVMQEIQDKLMQAVDLQRHPKAGGRSAFMDRSKFIAEMRQVMTGAGLDLGYEGLTNPAALKRLGLIYDFQLTDAHEYGRWKMGQDEALLEAWPCQEFLRVESRRKPRENWRVRWKIARGQLYKGRMIARKDDPVWLHPELNRFGRWWPPFDYNSGMGVRDVSREEAVELGVIGPDDRVAPKESEFNEGLQASVRGLDTSNLQKLIDYYGEGVSIGDGVAVYEQEKKIRELYASAITNPEPAGALRLGKASARAVDLARAVGVDLSDAEMQLTAGQIRHIINEHGQPGLLGPGSGEKRKGIIPVTLADLLMLPEVWRHPDDVRLSEKTKAGRPVLLYRKKSFGNLWMVTWYAHPETGLWRVSTVYHSTQKSAGGTPMEKTPEA